MQALHQLQKSIFQLLSTQVCGKFDGLNGVFHQVPPNTKLPYIHMELGSLVDMSNFRQKIYKISLKLHIYDGGNSNDFLLELMEATVQLFGNIANFSMDNYSVIDIRNKNILLEKDGDKIWKGLGEYDFIIGCR